MAARAHSDLAASNNRLEVVMAFAAAEADFDREWAGRVSNLRPWD